MNISFNWLKNYLKTDLPENKISQILTDIGLEVEGIEYKESIQGGLEGVLVGQVKEVLPHPNADRLRLTKVDVGHADLLDIVCGAPNVAEGQKVLVALVGTTLYSEGSGFKIKKSKIRGEVSEGMLCAEDELGLGDSHDGILVLEDKAKVGTAAAEYFEISRDVIFTIGLTPNRSDAVSHYGVARDLAAFLKLDDDQIKLEKPRTKKIAIEAEHPAIEVVVEDQEACPRYSSLVFSDITVKESPKWLKERLESIGLKPINNIVDVTNFVLHETGQPLHAFDASKIKGNKVIVKRAEQNTKFITLDGEERSLKENNLMICNETEPMCIAGVFGGISSGVTNTTKTIFLESAYFNPVSIRKTAKNHQLSTDASFRYERGADPAITVFALERAAYLLEEVGGAKVASEVQDFYPEPIEPCLIEVEYEYIEKIIGQQIDHHLIKEILANLEMKILHESKKGLRIQVPTYRVDVRREIDIVEEVLRIYGFNRVRLKGNMRSSIINTPKKDLHKIKNRVGDFLASRGYFEILNNSLSNPNYYTEEKVVKLENPLSKELEVMRSAMLPEGLSSLSYNIKRKRGVLKFFEFGRVYHHVEAASFEEVNHLALWLSGKQHQTDWQQPTTSLTFVDLKASVIDILSNIGVNKFKMTASTNHYELDHAVQILKGKMVLGTLGRVKSTFAEQFDIDQEVWFADLNWTNLMVCVKGDPIQIDAVSKFPSVNRDLALLIDKKVKFQQIESIAKECERKLLTKVALFDVYEGKNLEDGKKSYGVSFTFQDPSKTLTDKHIDKVMERLIDKLQNDLGATLR